MIKKLILLLLLSFSCALVAQEKGLNIENHPKTLFDEGKIALKNNDLDHAFVLFSLAQDSNYDDEINDKSLKKTDSLKILLRTKLTNQIIGNWKMLHNESWAMREPSDSVVGKMITIESNQILFYELYPKAKKWNLIKTENLLFSEKPNMSFDPILIVFSNKDVWKYYIDEISGNLIAYYIGQEYETGISEMVCGNQKLQYFKLQ
ncbi:hypothetical protein [Flavobacterium branchiicola]|uniref:Uncharacterized protein n=1 Tax=Flavobacterium branchiicola TaxID=1114875 RepID=A0ABV9PJW3_9FLAO|nr:hypothetical protein [Flavobacterium branchiicola]MBS7256249.1 hypothetical protein [Flavobacterium branchiicola]